jgi:hypothetical protein
MIRSLIKHHPQAMAMKGQLTVLETHMPTRCAAGICRNRGKWMCECGKFFCGRHLQPHQWRMQAAFEVQR